MANEVRLINYDAAIDRYYAEYEKQDICCGGQDRDWLKKCFDEAPTIDPETLRPKGRWVETIYSVHDGYTDEYSEEINFDCIVCDYCSDWKSPYCPNCGADMRGEG